ncbi:hypothetical protein [Synechococcus sp. WH 8016]|uniref:hypothetical protein n=1 Tax=Synechococcus sp. WH 8016 TaxID=166318 RepID=UPI00022D7ED8|nr:hypothetical protein [Synechococcus sp. WH 8016]EHA62215.1 hypothetical protein Syn8016DRAFT_1510 [Synechococcus sp. WH 8016]
MSQLFNDRALKQRHRSGDRNGPVTLLTPPLRATLGLGALIALAGGVWATFARIPVSVQGSGVLLPVSTINASLSGTNGSAVYMFNKPQKEWHKKARYFATSPDKVTNEELLKLAKSIYEESYNTVSLASGSSASEIFARNLKETFTGLKVPKGQLMMWIQSSGELERLSSTIEDVERAIATNKAQRENIERKQIILGKELKSRSSYLQSMNDLAKKGFVNMQSILQEQSQVDNVKSQILNNNDQLIEIINKLAESYSSLRGQTAKLINKQLIYAGQDLYISSIIPNNGEGVGEGDVLMQLSNNQLDQPVMVPVFLSSKEMAQVFPGMQALATPSGYKRSEVGGIRGKVVSMAKLPSGLQEVKARTGVKALAQSIVSEEPVPTLAVVALEQSDQSPINGGGYRWSSDSDLPYPPTPGDSLSVEITTRKVAPISLVIPAIRSFFGITPPEAPKGAAKQGSRAETDQSDNR